MATNHQFRVRISVGPLFSFLYPNNSLSLWKQNNNKMNGMIKEGGAAIDSTNAIIVGAGHYKKLFGYTHLPEHLQPVSKIFYDTSAEIIGTGGNPYMIKDALDKLWEVKNLTVAANGFMKEV